MVAAGPDDGSPAAATGPFTVGCMLLKCPEMHVFELSDSLEGRRKGEMRTTYLDWPQEGSREWPVAHSPPKDDLVAPLSWSHALPTERSRFSADVGRIEAKQLLKDKKLISSQCDVSSFLKLRELV